MFESKQKSIRNKMLCVRLTNEEMSTLDGIIKEFSKKYQRKRGNFIRLNIASSADYLEFTFKKMLEQSQLITLFQNSIHENNGESVKKYWKQYYDKDIRTNSHYLNQLDFESQQLEIEAIRQRAIQKGYQAITREARLWRNAYEESLERFIDNHHQNEELIRRFTNM